MLKIVFCADTHLGFDFSSSLHTSIRKRGDDFFDNFQRVLDFASDNEADFIVHGGDLFHRSNPPESVVNRAFEMLYDAAETGIKIILVPGNHERATLPNSIFSNHTNIYIFDEPKTFGFIEKQIYIQFIGFPCVNNNIRDNFHHIFQLATERINDSDYRFLCCHQTLQGASINNYTFNYGKDVLPLSNISNSINTVLCGHIHKSQILEGNQQLAIYPGSTERTSIVEKDEAKGFYYFQLQSSKLTHQFIELPTRPMFNLNLNIYTEDSQRLANCLQARIEELPNEAVVRLKCDIPQTRKILNPKFLQNIFPKTMSYRVAPISRKAYGT